jgi:hypothetical protein
MTGVYEIGTGGVQLKRVVIEENTSLVRVVVDPATFVIVDAVFDVVDDVSVVDDASLSAARFLEPMV